MNVKEKSTNRQLNKTKIQSAKHASFGKIQEDFYYYDRLCKSLSHICPSSKYEAELVQISTSLQKLYRKIAMELKSCKNYKENRFNTEQEEIIFG